MNELRSSSSSSSSTWRHPTVEWTWTRSTRDVEHNLAYDVLRSLPQPRVSSASRPPLPPPLLSLVGTRRTTASSRGVKLERVPTPTRADQLIDAHGDEHDVTVCFPRHSQSGITEIEQVKLVMMPNDSTDSDSQADVAVISRRPSYCQRKPSNAVGVIREAVPTSYGWAADVVSDRGQVAVGDWSAADKQVPDKMSGRMKKLSDARPDEVDGNTLTQTAGDIQPSAVHRRVLPSSTYRWTTNAAQRRAVEFDAKYWERRRKNNEAAKRSRDIRRANERHIALRAALLERENARLRSEVDMLTDDTLRLHYYLLCSHTFGCSHCRRHASE